MSERVDRIADAISLVDPADENHTPLPSIRWLRLQKLAPERMLDHPYLRPRAKQTDYSPGILALRNHHRAERSVNRSVNPVIIVRRSCGILQRYSVMIP